MNTKRTAKKSRIQRTVRERRCVVLAGAMTPKEAECMVAAANRLDVTVSSWMHEAAIRYLEICFQEVQRQNRKAPSRRLKSSAR